MVISSAYIRICTGRERQFSIIAKLNRIGLRMKPCDKLQEVILFWRFTPAA